MTIRDVHSAHNVVRDLHHSPPNNLHAIPPDIKSPRSINDEKKAVWHADVHGNAEVFCSTPGTSTVAVYTKLLAIEPHEDVITRGPIPEGNDACQVPRLIESECEGKADVGTKSHPAVCHHIEVADGVCLLPASTLITGIRGVGFAILSTFECALRCHRRPMSSIYKVHNK